MQEQGWGWGEEGSPGSKQLTQWTKDLTPNLHSAQCQVLLLPLLCHPALSGHCPGWQLARD